MTASEGTKPSKRRKKDAASIASGEIVDLGIINIRQDLGDDENLVTKPHI